MSRRGKKVEDKVEETPVADPTPPMDLGVKTAVVTEASLQPKVVPVEEPVAVASGWSRVNLKCIVGINGRNYGPGEGVLVPTDAFQSWRHALADGRE